MGQFTDRFPMAEFLLLALVASNWHVAVAASSQLHGHGAAGDKTSLVVQTSEACYNDESSSYLGIIGGLANLPGVPLGWNTMVHAAPVISAADAELVKRALAMGEVGETMDDTLYIASSEQPIGKGKAWHLSLLHGSKQVLTATSMYEDIQFASVYGVRTGSDRMIYEAVLTAFAAAIIACWAINSKFVTHGSLSQKKCIMVLAVVLLILSSIAHVRCEDDDDDEDPDPQRGAGNEPWNGAGATPIEGLVIQSVDFFMGDEFGGTLFLHEYEKAMSDNTEELVTGHYFTPLEVARPLRWIPVRLRVPDQELFATLLVRGDKGYNMAFMDGYGECWATSDAIRDNILPFENGKICQDLEFESNYRGLTNIPKPFSINPGLEIEIGREVALEAARVLAEYGRMPRTEANKEKARKAMRELTVMICEGPRINRIGDIMRHSWTTRTKLLPRAVSLIFKWRILSTHKCLGKKLVGNDHEGLKLIALDITTLADIDRELGMVKYILPMCKDQRIPIPSE